MDKIKNLGIMLDCSRDGVYTVEALKKYIDIISQMGYTTLQLYTEDVYEIDDPYFGYLRGRYSKAEIKEIDEYAFAHNIELIPCIQTLAHLSGYLRWREDICDCNDILLCGDEATYALIEKMFDACAECFRSRRINIGMDEAHMVGLGRYLDAHGYQNRFRILSEHLSRVVEIAGARGFKPMMWSDMFFRLANHGEYYVGDNPIDKSVTCCVPENLQLIYWDYYNTNKDHYDKMIKAHKLFKNDIVFAGGAWSWTGWVPNNGWSIKANESAVRACLEQGIEDIFITNWKDDGAEASLFATLPAMFLVSQMAKGIFDEALIKRNFKALLGTDFDAFMCIDELNHLDGALKISNPDKYMTYADPFLGIPDYTVDAEKAIHYEKTAQKLRAAEVGEYRYIFDTLAALADLLKYKYALGVNTREAYKADDRIRLEALIPDYTHAGQCAQALLEAFRTQWYMECKPYGFEKHCARLGGLSARLAECKRRLRDYLDGAVDSIPELTESILPVNKGDEPGESICFNGYLLSSRVKPFM